MQVCVFRLHCLGNNATGSLESYSPKTQAMLASPPLSLYYGTVPDTVVSVSSTDTIVTAHKLCTDWPRQAIVTL